MKKTKTEENELMEYVHDLIFDDFQADGMVEGKSWKGMRVFEPVYNEYRCVGYPLVVFVKDGEARVSTPQESLDYLGTKMEADHYLDGEFDKEPGEDEGDNKVEYRQNTSYAQILANDKAKEESGKK